MTIKIVSGNLLEATENIIVHQANCQSKMGSGIAKQIRNKWNNVYKAYLDYSNVFSDIGLLGDVLFVSVNETKDKIVANLYGQLKYGYDGKRYTNYEAIYSGLEQIRDYAIKNDYSVAIPFKLGSDRGGADWSVIYGMIESVFKDSEIDVTIYKWDGE